METYLLEGFFLEGRPTGPAFQDALAAHHQYIAQQVAAGAVLLAGPVPQDLPGAASWWVKTDDVAAFCQADPFVQRGVQRYDVIPFRVSMAKPPSKTGRNEGGRLCPKRYCTRE